MIALCRGTGWSLAEVMELEMDDFLEWLQTSQTLDGEIAEAMKKQ